MKKILLIVTGLFIYSCGDSLDSIWSDRTTALEKVATILESVTDEMSAEKAIQDLDAIKIDLDEIYQRKKKFSEKNAPPHNAEKTWRDDWESKKNKVIYKYDDRWFSASDRLQKVAAKLPLNVVQKLRELFLGNNEWFVRKP